MRFYLVDRIENIEIGKSINGIKCWTLSDEIFNEHFPGFPVVPGVLLIESMAQLLGVLIEKTITSLNPDTGKIFPILSIVHKAKFANFVMPGDKCFITGNLKTVDSKKALCSASISVDGKVMAETDLFFAIFKQESLPKNDYITRHEEYLHLLTISRDQLNNDPG